MDEDGFKEFDVTEIAREHMIGRLNEGYGLGERLNHAVDSWIGRITTYAWDDVKDAELRNLHGGNVGSPEGARDWLAGKVQGFLKNGANRVVICEDAGARPDYPYVKKHRTEMRFIDDHVYHLIQTDYTNWGWIRYTLGVAHLDLDIGAFTHAPPEVDLSREDRSITATDLDILAMNAVAAYVSAYDGESYLLWEKDVKPGS